MPKLIDLYTAMTDLDDLAIRVMADENRAGNTEASQIAMQVATFARHNAKMVLATAIASGWRPGRPVAITDETERPPLRQRFARAWAVLCGN